MMIGGIAEVILHTVALCSQLVRVNGVKVTRKGLSRMTFIYEIGITRLYTGFDLDIIVVKLELILLYF